MNVLNWSEPEEIKELHCGNKPVVVQCWTMGCPHPDGYFMEPV